METTIRPTILIVEGDRSLAEVMAYNFRREGYDVVIAVDVATGLAQAVAISPALMILERTLPGGDGLDVCRELRARAETAGVPFLVLVDRDEEMDREAGLALNIVDYVSKPFGVKELVQRVGTLLGTENLTENLSAAPDNIPDAKPSGRANRSALRPPTRQNVLFLCTGNAARSQMAEAFLRRYASERFDAFSAGLAPRGIHPLTTEVMGEIGIDLSAQRSKSVGEFLGRLAVHHAVIVCQKVEPNCPTMWPFALSQAYWPFEDPTACAGSHGDRLARFRVVRDLIDGKIRTWLVEQGISPIGLPASGAN